MSNWKTIAAMQKQYYWPRMEKMLLSTFLDHWNVNKSKAKHQHPRGLLQLEAKICSLKLGSYTIIALRYCFPFKVLRHDRTSCI